MSEALWLLVIGVLSILLSPWYHRTEAAFVQPVYRFVYLEFQMHIKTRSAHEPFPSFIFRQEFFDVNCYNNQLPLTL